ncbi:MAG: ABC transporter permease [Candidatus Eremiobacteraeota bacterium]|nr:ABC transporter permease [Candidatus Eremiobacteraeota bacterium]
MSYLFTHSGTVAGHLAEHLYLVLTSLGIAAAFALPLGVFVARSQRLGAIVLQILNVSYTIPSLALFAVLVPLFGIGSTTAIVALAIYAQMLLVRNVVLGLRGVPTALIEAARGLGMTPWQRFWRVEFPQALPVILGGVRIATVALIALATLGAWVDAGGLGVLILYGLEHDAPDRTIAGSIVAAVLAIIADRAFRLAERRFIT